MIEKTHELLEEILKRGLKESEKFDEVRHTGIIGEMYEGLTDKILNATIFKEFNLRVVKGVIRYQNMELSTQIDCMIVIDESLTETDLSKNVICPIENVIAIVEVKKNLYQKELHDSIEKMLDITNKINVRELLKMKKANLRMGDLINSYENIADQKIYDLSDLSDNMEKHNNHLFNLLLNDAHLPLRIIIGYNGFKKERSFGQSFINVTDELGEKLINGKWPTNGPNLVICKKFSAIKLNGMPYYMKNSNKNTHTDEVEMRTYGTHDREPFLCLLHILYTRLAFIYHREVGENELCINRRVLFGTSSNDIKLIPLMNMKIILTPKCISEGTNYKEEYYNEIRSKSKKKDYVWEPKYISEDCYNILKLIIDNNGKIEEDSLNTIVESHKFSALIEELTKLKLVYKFDKNIFWRKKFSILRLKDGKFAAGSDEDDEFLEWINLPKNEGCLYIEEGINYLKINDYNVLKSKK